MDRLSVRKAPSIYPFCASANISSKYVFSVSELNFDRNSFIFVFTSPTVCASFAVKAVNSTATAALFFGKLSPSPANAVSTAPVLSPSRYFATLTCA